MCSRPAVDVYPTTNCTSQSTKQPSSVWYQLTDPSLFCQLIWPASDSPHSLLLQQAHRPPYLSSVQTPLLITNPPRPAGDLSALTSGHQETDKWWPCACVPTDTDLGPANSDRPGLIRRRPPRPTPTLSAAAPSSTSTADYGLLHFYSRCLCKLLAAGLLSTYQTDLARLSYRMIRMRL